MHPAHTTDNQTPRPPRYRQAGLHHPNPHPIGLGVSGCRMSPRVCDVHHHLPPHQRLEPFPYFPLSVR